MSEISINNQEGSISCKSPSNIAIVKYWGKYGIQFPMNPSASFTLSEAFTQTTVKYKKIAPKLKEIELSYFFQGQRNVTFEQKVKKFLQNIANDFPFLYGYELEFQSSNSFPHSAGIASSASSMSAIALLLMQLSVQLNQKKYSEAEFWQKVSYYARLGSGSASRSVFNYAALWGKTDTVAGSSQEYAIGLENYLHSEFKTLHDSILIIDDGEKTVSSRAGHALMNNHPYKQARIEQANNNLNKLLPALEKGDWDTFIQISENEALSLHALMMSSSPWYSLLKASTLEVMQRIRFFREQTKTPVCFTLDAGPNVHILYPEKYKDKISTFINEELIRFATQEKVIHDRVGQKATILGNE